jgi:hypothetical protein
MENNERLIECSGCGSTDNLEMFAIRKNQEDLTRLQGWLFLCKECSKKGVDTVELSIKIND